MLAAVLARSEIALEPIVERMLRAAPHRGGQFAVQRLGRCAMGVGAHHAQPEEHLSTRGGPFLAALHGDLDNRDELVHQLHAAGIVRIESLADVVAAAFEMFGSSAPRRFRGAFAGAITDGVQLWCFRDHVGFRPLFYRHDDRAFTVATEAKQVVVGAGLDKQPDLETVTNIFYGRLPSDTPSALRGVDRLPQGTVLLTALDRAPVSHRYWHPEHCLETAHAPEPELRDEFLALFEQAVGRCLKGGDVVSLSGGVDSPAVAAFAATLFRAREGRALAALSAVFPDSPRVDERAYVELVVQDLAMTLHTYELTAKALDDARGWCELLDGPVPILSIPQVAEDCALVRTLGYSNVLTGEFAEFVFANHGGLVPHLLARGRWRALRELLRRERQDGKHRRALVRELVWPWVPAGLARGYRRWRGTGSEPRVPDWLDGAMVKGAFEEDTVAPHRRWIERQVQGFSGATLTMEADETCAAKHGVTIRRPFADVDLWEFFLSIPAEIKFPDRRPKTLVRRWLRGRVPDKILDRRDKTVFDDHAMLQIDYPVLTHLLHATEFTMPGVDYGRLTKRIDDKAFDVMDWFWAKDLARAHAFVSLW